MTSDAISTDWNPDHPLIQVAQDHLNDGMVDRDLIGDAARDDFKRVWRKAADAGVLQYLMPAEFGGNDGNAVTVALALEALGYGCGDAGLLLGLGGQLLAVQRPIAEFCTPEQKQAVLPDLISGARLGCICLTEPDAGSDILGMKTQAVADGDDFVITGEKHYIGLSPIADVAIVFAKTAPERGSWGISAFLVDMDDPAIDRDHAQDKMGLRSNPMGRVRFDGLRVPARAMMGNAGAGAAMFRRALEWERGLIFGCAVGSMRRQLEDCVTFADERNQFGEPVRSFQSVSNRLADMRVRIETGRMILLRAAQALDTGREVAMMTSMSKLHISEASLASVQDAFRIFGGQAYLRGHDIERALRDVTGGVIYSGTSDIQRKVIAGLL